MKYKNYEGYTKTYILVHNTGTGTMEDNYMEHEVVYETDDYDDAENKALELKLKNNPKKDIESSWCNNTYHININTLTDKGKRLLSDFKVRADESFKKLIKSGDYTVNEIDGVKFYMQNIPQNSKESFINPTSAIFIPDKPIRLKK